MAVHSSVAVADSLKFMKYVVENTSVGYTCNRPPGAAGAAIVTDTTILYASVSPPDMSPTCKQVGCEMENGHCVRAIHAEQRLITACARNGIATDGATVYSILKPCYNCTKILIAAGVKKIYYASRAYDEDRTRTILENAGVSCVHLDIGLEYGF